MTSCTLYRFFDGLDHLLYVGRTINPGRRWREHEKTKPWFDSVAKVTREVYATADALDAAERDAIATERPMYNVALNPSPAVFAAPVKPFRFDDHAESFAARLKAAFVPLEDIVGCLGDETACECSACHGKRLIEFEDLRSKYWWHPALEAAVDSVVREYYGGHDLCDWYYDLFDIELFGRMELVRASRTHPLPAYAQPSASGMNVDCPFCFGRHVHYLSEGAALERALDSGCPDLPCGQYFLLDDWEDQIAALEAWGERYGKRAAA